MSRNPTSPERDSDAETIDELISAALDGALDAAAGDFGFTPARARAVVAEHADRSADLGAARDLLATPPPPLDELTRRRFVSEAATRSGSPDTSGLEGPDRSDGFAARSRRHRTTAAMAGIAAAVLVVAGVGALLTVGSDGGGDDSAADGESTAVAGSATALEPSADLGEVSDPAVLRERLLEVTPAPAPANPDTDASEASVAADESDAQESSVDAGSAETPETTEAGGDGTGFRDPERTGAPGGQESPPASIECSTLLAADFDDVGAPLVLATATFDGAPAGVLVLGDAVAGLAVVFATDDCTILATQSLTAP